MEIEANQWILMESPFVFQVTYSRIFFKYKKDGNQMLHNKSYCCESLFGTERYPEDFYFFIAKIYY